MTSLNDIPNLDAMSSDELLAFWNEHQGGHKWSRLMPHGGPGSRKTAAALARYAINRVIAVQCRRDGCIDRALVYERVCDRIYETLPVSLRW